MANYYLTESDFEFIKQHDYIHTDYFWGVYGLLPEFKQSGRQIIFDFSVILGDKAHSWGRMFRLIKLMIISRLSERQVQMINITEEVHKAVKESGIANGLVAVS